MKHKVLRSETNANHVTPGDDRNVDWIAMDDLRFFQDFHGLANHWRWTREKGDGLERYKWKRGQEESSSSETGLIAVDDDFVHGHGN